MEWPEGFTGGWAEAVLACSALIILGLVWRRTRGASSAIEPGAALCLAWFLVPVALLIAYSLVGHRIFGGRRYLLFVGPAYLLLIARGISSLPRPVLRFAAVAILTVVSGTAMVRRSFANDRPDWQGAASVIRRGDPWAPVVVMDENERRYHMACLGFYLPAGQQPIPVRQEVAGLASSRADSLWLVIETPPVEHRVADPRRADRALCRRADMDPPRGDPHPCAVPGLRWHRSHRRPDHSFTVTTRSTYGNGATLRVETA